MSNAPPTRSTHLLRWNNLYTQTELYRSAVRVYTKPLFHWRKALCTSTDGRTLYDFAANGLRGLDSLHRSLMRRQFNFRPAMALHYNFNGKHRTLYISPWEERIVDLLLYRALNRRLHTWFSDNSYAYREQGYALDVCQSRITAFLRAAGSPVYALKRDIADYFATVDHEILLGKLAELVDPEDYLFQLLVQRIRFRYEDNGEPQVADQGIPFGTAIACLFANVYLTELDRRLESISGVAYYRYADDILVLSRERQPALLAAEQLESTLAGLKLKLKASHRADLLLASESIEDQPFTSVREFRHLGLLFRSGGQVSLSRDKLRKIQNLFRFAFRRSRRRWRRITDPKARAQALVAVAVDTLERGLRNVAIVDYYLKHVGDENQLRTLDRWLAEEVLSQVFGGHKKGHFRRISFAQLRTMGLPSLVHRRRLIRRGRIESPFFIWQQEKAARAFRGTVARLHGSSSQAAFSSVPEAAAGKRP
jgi:hypothetical protein